MTIQDRTRLVNQAVDRKLAEGEIHIGPPTTKIGEGILVDPDGRYWVLEAEVTA